MDELTRLVKVLSSGDYNSTEIKDICLTVHPNTDEKAIEELCQNGKGTNLAERARDWVALQERVFRVTSMVQELHCVTSKEKANLRQIVNRMKKDGIIEPYGKEAGKYRPIGQGDDEIDFMSANPNEEVPLYLPFNFHRRIKTFPKNIHVVSGESNAGKTAYLMNIVDLNLDNKKLPPINYFSSEMPKEELRMRLEPYERDIEDFKKCRWVDKEDNFHDSIRPNEINIIDYLEVNEDFWMVGALIRKIYEKLNKGVAIVAIQKDKGKQFGSGGEKSIYKARFYINMLECGKNKGRLQVKKAKFPRNAAVDNPNGEVFNYAIYNGCEFTFDDKRPLPMDL